MTSTSRPCWWTIPGAPSSSPDMGPRLPAFARLGGLVGVVALLFVGPAPAAAQTPAGEITASFHVTLAPTWFDPSTAPAQITPFGVLYAVHDPPVRPPPR